MYISDFFVANSTFYKCLNIEIVIASSKIINFGCFQSLKILLVIFLSVGN